MNVVNWDNEEIPPSKVVCIGRNFVDHIKELNNEISDELVVFLKPNSSISHELHSGQDEDLHYEGEITFLINDNALNAVGFGLDLTKRALQTKLKSKGLPWERAKSFDRAAVFSQFVSFHGEIAELRMELFINDDLVQSGGCDLMLKQPKEIFDEVSRSFSFEKGDLLMCGTPKGVGVVSTGDKFTGKVFAKETLLVEKTWLVK